MYYLNVLCLENEKCQTLSN